jgi:hypothetical protein
VFAATSGSSNGVRLNGREFKYPAVAAGCVGFRRGDIDDCSAVLGGLDVQAKCRASFAAHALATAQTLWSVAGTDENWRRPVDSIIRQHRAYLRAGAFVCGD